MIPGSRRRGGPVHGQVSQKLEVGKSRLRQAKEAESANKGKREGEGSASSPGNTTAGAAGGGVGV